ncbi:MAG TPA: hypothetical protein VMB52_04995 [Verrucomicrobiae bacterium]|nr:hypothetical protein [Verrucomicrobiae bacterium]
MSQEEVATLYSEVVRITYDYLGPAADRFVTRQIRSHLGKSPDELRKGDLKELISWIKVAVALLTDDEKLIKRYISDLRRLTT